MRFADVVVDDDVVVVAAAVAVETLDWLAEHIYL